MIICSLLCLALPARGLEICGDLEQGELLLIKDLNSKKISIRNDQNTKEYLFFDKTALIALPRDADKQVELKTDSAAFVLQVKPKKWDVQSVFGVAPHHVTPSAQHKKAIEREQKDVATALQKYNLQNFWREGFIVPLEGKISGNFGNQRIFNGVPKSPHNGTDIAAPEGTAVKASGSGIVSLSESDYFYTGNMIIIDHGQGLQTIYAHLQKSLVSAGQYVQKGEVIGYVGSTGRATGAHLHWGAVVNGIRFRPHSLLAIEKKKCLKINNEQ